ncbi:hypothetical protein NECAME_16580 [Necator americanus]|uniref:Uncharacterized protein n=1 Tax=Necator americanus TaxID=51031 RepID=W2TUZ8_NECAM|nr:hypothetical protein NECAME_16580 [Necator americanus]ETN85925.1 hypothetical protein NECAME_16580 [Necator americanus]
MNNRSTDDTDEKVMFFAFYVGNDAVSTFQQKLAVNSTSCSLTMRLYPIQKTVNFQSNVLEEKNERISSLRDSHLAKAFVSGMKSSS